MTTRYIGEIVVLTRDCELGEQGERAKVINVDGNYMAIQFLESGEIRRTGTDYLYLTNADVAAREQAERERAASERAAEGRRLSAEGVAIRAKEIQDACLKLGVSDASVIAAAIVADRIEDTQNELDYIGKRLDDIDTRLSERSR